MTPFLWFRGLSLPLITGVFLTDALFKFVAHRWLTSGGVELFSGVTLRIFENTRGPFGLLPLWLAVVFSTLTLLGFGGQLARLYQAKDTRIRRLSLSLLVGGGVANLVERLIFGHTTDFLWLGNRAVLNVADVAILDGALGLLTIFLVRAVFPRRDSGVGLNARFTASPLFRTIWKRTMLRILPLRHRTVLSIIFLVLAPVTLAGWTQRASIRGWFLERPFRTELPSAQPAAAVVLSEGQPSTVPTRRTALAPAAPVGTPASARAVNLAVPFAPQAPTANWAQPYQDACEEAAIIMIERFFRGAKLSLQEMDAEILRMVRFQEERYGFFKDSNAAETARLAEAFYPHLSAQVVYDATADTIRGALAQGTPVLGLVNGRKLGNPFYTQPGPERHAIVIKGVTGDKFITNDPGTRRGADFVYPIPTVLGALDDYDGGSPGTRKPVVLLLTPKKR